MTYEIVEAARARTRRAVIAAVTVVALLLLGMAALVLRSSSGEKNASGPGETPVTVSPVSGPATPDPTTSVFPASDLSWSNSLGFTWLPISSSAGPHELRDGRAKSFAHSPLGAVMAALHISMRSDAFAGPGIFEPTVTEQVVGFETGQLLALDRRTYAASQLDSGLPAGGPLTTNSGVTVLGYRVLAYTESGADVRFLLTGPESDTQLYENASVQWMDGDWRLIAPEDGIWDIGPDTNVGLYTMFPPRNG